MWILISLGFTSTSKLLIFCASLFFLKSLSSYKHTYYLGYLFQFFFKTFYERYSYCLRIGFINKNVNCSEFVIYWLRLLPTKELFEFFQTLILFLHFFMNQIIAKITDRWSIKMELQYLMLFVICLIVYNIWILASECFW